jgi:hypothetical protein
MNYLIKQITRIVQRLKIKIYLWRNRNYLKEMWKIQDNEL